MLTEITAENIKDAAVQYANMTSGPLDNSNTADWNRNHNAMMGAYEWLRYITDTPYNQNPPVRGKKPDGKPDATITESVMAEFTPVFNAMAKKNQAIAKVYDCLHNGIHPAQVIETLSYQIIRLLAQLETAEKLYSAPKPVVAYDPNSVTQDWTAVSPDVILSMQNIRVHKYPDAAIEEVNEINPESFKGYHHIEVHGRMTGKSAAAEAYGRSIEGQAIEAYKAIKRVDEKTGDLIRGFSIVQSGPASVPTERDTLHICYYCGQLPPVTTFDGFDICGACSDFLTGQNI